MSIEHSAKLFYGLKVMDDKLINKANEDDLDVSKGLQLVSSGCDSSDYSEDDEDNPLTLFVAITKSVIRVDLYEHNKQIKQEKLMSPKEWHEQLTAWAKENDCSKFKIGWFLTICEL